VAFQKFRQAGHLPTLFASFCYFDFSFMVWVALGPTIIYITRPLGLAVSEKFTLVALPILAGAFLRVILGLCTDHFGGKRTGTIAQLAVIASIAYTWLWGLNSKLEIELLGVALGLAGASFAVALPQASRWYPPHYQGVVMGIAGAGNMGVVLETTTAPYLAEHLGWQNAFGILLIPLLLTLLLYVWVVKEPPVPKRQVTWADYRALLVDRDTRWFMFFYSITFGGFVGLANALPLYFTEQYDLSGISAGMMAAVIVMFGACFRPIGGLVADRVGGVRALGVLFGVVALAYFGEACLPVGPTAPTGAGWDLAEIPSIAWLAVLLFSAGVLALGMGNGAVFQLIPLRFREEIGAMTGLVGCAGGIGGFFLANALGLSQRTTGAFTAGLLAFGLLASSGLVGIITVRSRWRTNWRVVGARI
jgi:NNP family nitrate/nitrite transporter-like MFS transporter